MENNCFANINGKCTGLSVGRCTYPKCSFYKLKTINDRQKEEAIKRCRELKRCLDCKYTSNPCKLHGDKEDK